MEATASDPHRLTSSVLLLGEGKEWGFDVGCEVWGYEHCEV